MLPFWEAVVRLIRYYLKEEFKERMFPVCYYLVATFSVSRDLEIYLMVKLIVVLWLCFN